MRRSHEIIITVVLAFALIAGMQVTASAQTCEFPLFIQNGSVDANVLLLIDNSGSMNEAIWHDDYNPDVSYSGGLKRTSTYFVSSNGYYSASSFRNGEPTSPTAYLVTSDAGQSARYSGNYLNWIFYHATATQRATLPAVTRIQVAKPAVLGIVANNPNVRFGAWKFDYSEGADNTFVGPTTDHAQIVNFVNNIAATTWTPIGESMADIYDYVLSSDSSADPAIQYACQRTFMVVITDGLPTQDDTRPAGIYDGSHWQSDGEWIDDLAAYMRSTDASARLADDQIINTYTVGFNVDANVLQQAANAGDGLYVTAFNPAQLTQSLQRVLRDIMNRISSGSAVAVVSTEGQSDDFLYRGRFEPGSWKGWLEGFQLPYEAGEAPAWEAAEELLAMGAANRTIYWNRDGDPYLDEFNVGSAADLEIPLQTASLTEATNLINWVRGEYVPGLRDREWAGRSGLEQHMLGDVIESSPQVVGPPTGYILHNDYLAWRQANETRERMIYIGSNDGMIHCFNALTGVEKWAFIPTEQLDKQMGLADPDYCHEFSCNLTPKVFDAYVNGTWRTILVAGMKQGGASYVALDITYPDYPQLMWEVSIPNMHESWARPELAYLQHLGEYVIFAGTGPDKTTGVAELVMMSLVDGSVMDRWVLSNNGGIAMNKATAAVSVDLDFDGYDDHLYVSDLDGHLYVMNFDANGIDGPNELFDTGGQPIQAHPIVTVDYNNDVFVYFGTGRYMESGDFSDTTPQTFYSIIDKHDGMSVSRGNLVDETSTITQVGPNDKGWFIDLVQRPGERVTEPDALVAGVIYFTSYQPNANPCSAGGTSWLYSVDFRNGSSADGDDDPSNDTTDGRVEEIGEGIATKPVVDVVNEEVIVQGSDTRIHLRDTRSRINLLMVRSWRQLYN